MVERTHLLVAHEDVRCALCDRTLLTGERAAFFTAPAQGTRLICELCAPRVRRWDWTAAGGAWSRSGQLTMAEAVARASPDDPGAP